MDLYVIGVDPGPQSGIIRLHLVESAAGPFVAHSAAIQVTTTALLDVLEGLVYNQPRVFVAVEQFVVGMRAARSASAGAGKETRIVLRAVQDWAQVKHFKTYVRTASEVKPWATDTRLDKLGLLDLTVGMRHARDAARHALFAAVRSCGLPDPLSRKVETVEAGVL